MTRSNLDKFTAPRAQSSQAPLLESAADWKVHFYVNNEGVSVKALCDCCCLWTGLSSRWCRADEVSHVDRAHEPLGRDLDQDTLRTNGQVQ